VGYALTTPVVDEGKNGGRRGVVRDDRHGDDGGGKGGAVISLLFVRWVEGTADHEEKQKGQRLAANRCAWSRLRRQRLSRSCSARKRRRAHRRIPIVRICAELYGSRRENRPVTDQNLSDQQSRRIASQIREELARRRISRRGLADLAKISISTLEKALSGRRPFTLATTIRIEEALGVSLRAKGPDAPPAPSGLAPGELGYYSRPSVAWLEGIYVTLRPSFSDPAAISAYRTEILWDDENSRLMFRESERIDAAFSQAGAVSVPNQSGHIYFVTNRNGQYRLVIVSRPTISGEMYGIMTTLQSGRGSQLMPVAAPLVLVPEKALKAVQFGRISAGDACHAVYRQYLARTVEEPFALFLPP
jgi:transcriptional regulator with XRE-family HTH domain